MSLFFRHRPTAEANFSVRGIDEATAGDTVLVSRPVWEALCYSSESRQVVSIKPKLQYSAGSFAGHVDGLTCWAVYDPTVSGIVVPPAWLATYPTIFQPFQVTSHGPFKSVIMSPTEDITLTEVVLTAKYEEAYAVASINGEVLENWLLVSQVIIRDGEEIVIPSSVFVPGLSNQTSSPALCYTVSLALPYKQGIAQRGSTRFIVISSDQVAQTSDVVDGVPGPENLEINESFLISTALSLSGPLSQANKKATAPGVVFSVETLRSHIDADFDQDTVYICASSLRLLGVLNGDWALASPVDSPTSRLVRVRALDAAFDGSRRSSALLSPILLYNLCPRGSSQLVLRLSPYGGRDLATAKSVTLARVSSPFSIHRRYEPFFLDALHEYFGSSNRLLKNGDIIPLRINVDYLLDPQSITRQCGFNRVAMHNYSYVPVYFVVRDVDCETLPAQTHGEPFSVFDVGCFINSNITKIVQAGVEHTEVPDVYDYHELGHARLASPSAIGVSHQVDQLSNVMSLDQTYTSARPTVFITGARGTGKFSAAICIARRFQMHLVEINCFSVLSDTVIKTESILRDQLETVIACSPCLVVLRHIDALCHPSAVNGNEGLSPLLRTLLEWVDGVNKLQGKKCILAMTAEHGKTIGDIFSFSNEIEIKALNEEERFNLLLAQVDSQDALLAPDVSVAALAKQTAALVASDLASLVQKTCLCAIVNCGQHQLTTQPVASAMQFNTALLKARSTFAQSIGVPSIPMVFWEDIGGLDSVKNEILDTVQLPLDHPQMFQDGLKKRSGILLYGPPGTGKTLLAKAVATSCSLNFFSVKGPELLNMYIGESEANVRRVFQRARDAKPCVIFFDELDSIAPKRGNQGDSGGVMDRIVSQLLAELDGMSVGGMDVFVIGATNRPDLLDPALLRPGRFDKMLYLGVCETHAAQLDILKALTRKFNLDTNLDLSTIADHCPFNYTGADFYALCADALLHSLSCKVVELEEERAQLNALSKYKHHPISPQFFISEMKSNADLQLVVKAEDFEFALIELIPSISNSELLHYISIQQNWHN